MEIDVTHMVEDLDSMCMLSGSVDDDQTKGTFQMYALDLSTCTVRDVIARSITCHPSLLCDTLRDISRAVATMFDSEARTSALKMQGAAHKAVELVHDAFSGDDRAAAADTIVADFNMMQITFGAASKLQCIPFATSLEIMRRYELANTGKVMGGDVS